MTGWGRVKSLAGDLSGNRGALTDGFFSAAENFRPKHPDSTQKPRPL